MFTLWQGDKSVCACHALKFGVSNSFLQSEEEAYFHVFDRLWGQNKIHI